MLGSLLGTLQKFRQEEGAAVRQELVAKRATILQRAEEKEKEESRRLKELERSTLGEKCREEQQRRQRLEAQIQEKRLRLAHVNWVANKERIFSFLQTAATPALLYLPSRLNEAAQLAMQERRDLLSAFQQSDELREAEEKLESSIRALHASADQAQEPMTVEEGEIAEGHAAPEPFIVHATAAADADEGELEEETGTGAADPESLQDLLA
jgi:hypothetical protein